MGADSDSHSGLKLWFPFTSQEFSFIIGAIGFTAAVLSSFNISKAFVAWGTLGSLAVAYFAGLLVYSRRERSRYRYIENGGMNAAGYMDAFRSAKKHILLTHVDDDSPSEEINMIYRQLLERGVQLRRLVFVRENAHAQNYKWIADFGEHKNLHHRYLCVPDAYAMRFSFVVVDTEWVLVSLPGHETIDQFYEDDDIFILRHLVEIRDPKAAAVYEKIHKTLWKAALPARESTVWNDCTQLPMRQSSPPPVPVSTPQVFAPASFGQDQGVPEPSQGQDEDG